MTSSVVTPPSPPRAARPKRGEGQWALGYREPLNANEQAKKDDDALNVRARIETIYAHHGFDAIDGIDLRNRFRWWGLYTQRKPGIDGGKTGALEPQELDDKYFMLRVRIDGGQLDTAQLRAIADVSATYARDTADITDRQNIQLHWIAVEDVPAIWDRLESVGLSTQEACGDAPRVIIASPVAGIAADEIIDPTWAVEEISNRYIGSPEFSNLPRKFKTALTGHPSQDVAPETNDISFVGVVHPEHGPGFDVWVGGGLSTNPMLAKRLGAWVPLEEVPDVWWGVISVFRDYGYRRLRSRARLKFLLADWGVEKFRTVLENEYLQRSLIDGPAPAAPTGSGDHIGVHPQRDDRFFVGVTPTVGRVGGAQLAKLADVAEAHGVTRLRTTPYQKLLLLDVEPEPGRFAGRGTGWHRALGAPFPVATQHDGLHRHRVLQARDRGDQGACAPAGRRAGAASARARHADNRERQRLPQLMREDPGRGHRAEGTTGGRCRREPGRRLPGASRRRAGAGSEVRP